MQRAPAGLRGLQPLPLRPASRDEIEDALAFALPCGGPTSVRQGQRDDGEDQRRALGQVS
jgi:hypothetical protein